MAKVVLNYLFLAATLVTVRLFAEPGHTASNVSRIKETLYVLAQLPYPLPNSIGMLPSWSVGLDVVPALNLAVKLINNDSELLPNHTIELVHINGGCDYVDLAVANLTEAVARLDRDVGRRFVGLIGPGCSRSTFGVAPLTNVTQLNMVTLHGAGASIYSDRTTYPNLFGSLGSVKSFGDISAALIQRTNWLKVAILFHGRIFYSSIKNEIINAINLKTEAEIIYSSAVELDTFLPLADVQQSRARIIFVATPPEHFRRIMCLAFYMGMIYPAYQWIYAAGELTIDEFVATANNVSFLYDDAPYNCSITNFEEALNYSLFINYLLKPSDEAAISVAGLNYTQYLDLYQQEVDEYNSNDLNPFQNLTTTIWAGYFYDSVWALAMALHNVTVKYNVSLSGNQFKYHNITQLVAEELYNVDFMGNSGPIKFSRETGFLTREIHLTQIIGFQEVFITISNATQNFTFIDDEFEIENSIAHPALAGLSGFITILQFAVVIILHILTAVYRNHSSVKASSPKITHIAFVGIYFLVIALLLVSINELPNLGGNVRASFCQAVWAWFLPLSCTLALGPVIVRTWRLYRIFTHYLNPGPFVSDPVLITVVCVMVAVDVIIATVWTSIDDMRLKELQHIVKDDNVTSLAIRLGCRSNYYFVWLGVNGVYKIAIIIVMCLLAFLTRNINNKSFTTESLRVFGYLTAVIFTLGFSTYFIISLVTFDPDSELGVFSATLNLVLLMYIICVFVPPLVQPIRNRFGGRRNSETHQTRSISGNSTGITRILGEKKISKQKHH